MYVCVGWCSCLGKHTWLVCLHQRKGYDSSFRHSNDVICESRLQTLQHKRSFFKGLNGLLLKYAHLCGNWSDVVIRISFIHSVLCTELETPRYGGWSWDTNGYCKPSEMCWWCRWYHWIQKTPFLSILASCFICYCLQGILFRSVWLSTALIMDEDTEETLGANSIFEWENERKESCRPHCGSDIYWRAVGQNGNV